LNKRIFIGAVLFVAAAAAHASGQATNPEFVHGRDYTFERMVARRAVHDADDNGTAIQNPRRRYLTRCPERWIGFVETRVQEQLPRI
jgi:hypothetical protein